MFGTAKQHELWKELGLDRAWLYLGMTIEIHIFAGKERICEIAILSDDKTAVVISSKFDFFDSPEFEDVRQAFKRFGYTLKSFQNLTKIQKEELGFPEME